MTQSRLTIAFLSIALFAGLFSRFTALAAKSNLAHDEAISYLSVTVHLSDYQRTVTQKLPPYGSWAAASQWKKFWTLEQPFCFAQIRSDQARHDIHPPLYFWLLHLWSLVVGVHLWTGPLLNLLIDLITGLLLYKFARYVLTEPFAAAIVACLWLLCPSVIESSGQARQYSLLSLWTVLIAWRTLKFSDLNRSFGFQDILTWSILIAAGALTHYHFALPVAGCVLWLIFKLQPRRPRRFLFVLVGIAAGLLLFAALHPEFYISFRIQPRQTTSFTWTGFADRLIRVAYALGPYRFKDALTSQYGQLFSIIAVGMYLLSLVLLICLVVVFRKYKINLLSYLRTVDAKLLFVVYLFLWIAGVTIGLYLSFISPLHAMGGRYLTMAWPLFAFVLLLILRVFPQKPTFAAVLLCLIITLSSFSFVVAEIFYARSRRLADPAVMSTDNPPNVILDNVARGVLPRLIWRLPNDTLIFAAHQQDLIARQNLWINQLKPSSLYLSQISYNANPADRQKIIDIISQKHHLRLLPGRWSGLGEVYQIFEPSPTPGPPHRSDR